MEKCVNLGKQFLTYYCRSSHTALSLMFCVKLFCLSHNFCAFFFCSLCDYDFFFSSFYCPNLLHNCKLCLFWTMTCLLTQNSFPKIPRITTKQCACMCVCMRVFVCMCERVSICVWLLHVLSDRNGHPKKFSNFFFFFLSLKTNYL